MKKTLAAAVIAASFTGICIAAHNTGNFAYTSVPHVAYDTTPDKTGWNGSDSSGMHTMGDSSNRWSDSSGSMMRDSTRK